MALQNFVSFVADFRAVSALLAKLALIAPFATLLLSIGPPWPGRTAVPTLTSLCELIVLIYTFQFYTGLSRRRVEFRLRAYVLLLAVTCLVYLGLYSFFVFDVPLNGDRDVKGFIVQPAIQTLVSPGHNLEYLLQGAEWDPSRIWEEWTIYVVRLCLLVVWIMVFVGIAGCIATFVVLQRAQAASLPNGHALPRSPSADRRRPPLAPDADTVRRRGSPR